MAGLNLHAIVIGIVVLTTALDVNGRIIDLRLSISTVAEFFISSDARTWINTIEYCRSTGKILADLDKKDERDALQFALSHHNYPDGTEFWVFTCTLDPQHYCEGHCTLVIYKKKQPFVYKTLHGTACDTRKKYIWRE